MGHKLSGTITIDYLNREVIADFGNKLITSERKAILKQFLNDICSEESIINYGEVVFFVFKDMHANKIRPNKLLNEIIRYSKNAELNRNREEDKIAYILVTSINKLKKYKIDGIKNIIEYVVYLSNGNDKKYLSVCFHILHRYLQENKYKGILKVLYKKIGYKIVYMEI